MVGKTPLLSANELKRVDPHSLQTEIGMGAAIIAFTPHGMSESGAGCHTVPLYKQYNLPSLPITHRPVQVKCHTDGTFSRSANLQNCVKLLLASSCPSVHPSVCVPASNKSPPNEWVFIKFDV